MRFKRLLLFSLLFCYAESLWSQEEAPDTTVHPRFRKSSFIPLPIVFYTPETRLGGGAALLYAFRFGGQSDHMRPSQLQLGLAYTQEKQVLTYLPFQIFTNDEKFNIYGELGYYRYVYKFFGIGNDTPADQEETYQANYPRVRLNGLYLVRPHLYAGVRYWFDDYRITGRDSSGLLIENDITGSEGGVISGGGPVINYDSRDNIFFPTTGILAELEFFHNAKVLGSDFNFSRISFDGSAYFPVAQNHVFAVNAWLVMLYGDSPFQQLALLGGPRKMRGYFEGRYRDRKLWTLQAEYRMPLFWRLGAVVFGGMGSVAPNRAGVFSRRLHFTYGAGLRVRLTAQDPINLRIDVGGNEQGDFFPYLTVREAF